MIDPLTVLLVTMAKFLTGLGIVGLVLLGALGWWFFAYAFVASDTTGDEAIAHLSEILELPSEQATDEISEAHVIVIVAGIDPSLFARFQATPSLIESTIRRYNLTETPMASYDCQQMLSSGPWRLWWNPDAYPVHHCYKGENQGDLFYLLYQPEKKVAFLQLQDT